MLVDNKDLIVGVATNEIDFHAHPSDGLEYWGYVCCAGEKVGFGEDVSRYGDICSINDKIGVLLEFNKDDAKLTFFKNQVRSYISLIDIEKSGSRFFRVASGHILPSGDNVLRSC